jgi:hypothetical protein
MGLTSPYSPANGSRPVLKAWDQSGPGQHPNGALLIGVDDHGIGPPGIAQNGDDTVTAHAGPLHRTLITTDGQGHGHILTGGCDRFPGEVARTADRSDFAFLGLGHSLDG